MDLPAYLQRIGFSGTPAPDLATLRELHRLHPQAIAFENLDPLRGAAPVLELAWVEDKLVRGRRGGYCFEHNLLLREALLAIGFRVRGLAARVLWNAPEGAIPPRGHMLLRVGAPGDPDEYIADVGFGGQVLTAPLRLDLRLAQPTPHEPFRLVEHAGAYTLESQLAGAWKALYRFDLTEQHPIDYTASNWYLATHPGSHFVTSLIAARTEPGRRYALRNTSLAIHRLGAETERTTLGSVAELRATLDTLFQLAVPDDPALDRALERLIEAAPA